MSDEPKSNDELILQGMVTAMNFVDRALGEPWNRHKASAEAQLAAAQARIAALYAENAQFRDAIKQMVADNRESDEEFENMVRELASTKAECERLRSENRKMYETWVSHEHN